MEAIIQRLAQEFSVPAKHVENVINLLDEGNTVPFIARYRKEMHGGMDDQLIRQLADRLQYLRGLDKRRQEVKTAIENQGKLTDELAQAIDAAQTLAEVEDLYRPYQQKRRTRATMAKEKGLEPLAQTLYDQKRDCPAPETLAQDFINPDLGVEDVAAALQGASDIVAEWISDDADIRKTLRTLYGKKAMLVSKAAAKEPEDTVYRLYYELSAPVSKVMGHQVLAINRGEREDILKVSVDMDEEEALVAVRRQVVRPGTPAMAFVKAAAEDAYRRLIAPSLEREVRSDLTEKASEPRLPHGVQGGGHRPHGQGAGHHRGLSHPRGTGQAGGHHQALRPGEEAPRAAHRHRKRHRQPGDRADGGGDDWEAQLRRHLYDGQRGGGVGVLRLQAGRRGVPRL